MMCNLGDPISLRHPVDKRPWDNSEDQVSETIIFDNSSLIITQSRVSEISRWPRAVCQRFHDEMRRSHLVVKSLTHGSWSGNIVNRTPPRGGGFFRSMCDKTCSNVWYHMCDMIHSNVWHYVCDMIQLHVRHDSFICFTSLVQICDITCVTRLIHMCDMAHTHVWHSRVWHASFICVIWLVHTCDGIHVTCHTYRWVMTHLCHQTHSWGTAIRRPHFCVHIYMYV